MFSFYFLHRFEAGLYTTRFEFDTQPISLIPSLICSLVIAILSIITIITANKYRKGILDIRISWLVSVIVTVIAAIIWMIIIEFSIRVLYGHEFWGLLSPGFGIIGLFLGTVLEVLGFLLSKKN